MDKTQVKIGSLLRESMAHELQGRGLISKYWIVESIDDRLSGVRLLRVRDVAGTQKDSLGMQYFLKSRLWKLES